MRIVHAPKNPAGLATAVATGQRELGHEVTTVVTRSDFTVGDVDINHQLDDRAGAAYVRGHVDALRSLPPADVVNLWYGATFLHWPRFGAVLPDLRWLARRQPLVATYVGSDARRALQRGGPMQRAAEESLGSRSDAALRRLDRSQARSIEKMAAAAGAMLAVNPDLLRWLPDELARFVPYAVTLATQNVVPDPPDRRRPFRVLHAPGNPAMKGSTTIDAVMGNLVERRGGDVEYRRVSRLSHEQFVAELVDADLFIDQILIGWYGVSSIEAMRCRTPAVCFIDDDDLGQVPAEMANTLPIIRADAGSLASVVETAMAERDGLADLAADALDWSWRWHDPVVVAQQVLDAYPRIGS